MRISNDAFSTCEETCEMKNRTKVRSMCPVHCTDVCFCKTDGALPLLRIGCFSTEYRKPNSAAGALAIGNNGRAGRTREMQVECVGGGRAASVEGHTLACPFGKTNLSKQDDRWLAYALATTIHETAMTMG